MIPSSDTPALVPVSPGCHKALCLIPDVPIIPVLTEHPSAREPAGWVGVLPAPAFGTSNEKAPTAPQLGWEFLQIPSFLGCHPAKVTALRAQPELAQVLLDKPAA